MTIGFYHAGSVSPYAAAMVASARRVMPTVPVVQFSPNDTAAVRGVNDVRITAAESRIARAVLEAFASVSGEWLFLDTDVLVQRDVQAVFDQAFDVAVAQRAGTFKDEAEAATAFMARMPVNKGVVFSRSQAFWQSALETICAYKDCRQQWMGDQQAVCEVIASGVFHVEHLPNAFNYPPKTAREDVREKALLHYKGDRKAWMLARRIA